MQTRSLIRWLVLAAGLSGLYLATARAAEEPPAAGQEAGESQPVEEVPPGDAGEDDNAGEEDAPSAGTVAGQMGEVSLEEFVPSEEIGADGAVSFPVDI